MSVGATPALAVGGARLGTRLCLGAAAILVAALVLTGLSILVAPTVAPPTRSPFGMGLREAAPAATGIGGWILALQSSFSRSLQAAVAAMKAEGGWGPMLLLGFTYGVFHAAGPGHGKAVIADYLLAGERALGRGFSLSLAAALLQAMVAIAIVGVGTLLLGATAASMTHAGTAIETASFVLVALLGSAMTWRKAGRLATIVDGSTGPATLAMALGTALTTGLLASLAVFAKAVALRLAAGRSRTGALFVGSLEVLAGAFVMILGLAMLAGLAVGVGG
jgi:ABC-type nickel/cobalt efflux system permease component RcnA